MTMTSCIGHPQDAEDADDDDGSMSGNMSKTRQRRSKGVGGAISSGRRELAAKAAERTARR